MVLGMLVDEGLLSWTDAVATYLPDFVLMDPFANARCTIADLLAHVRGAWDGGRGVWVGWGQRVVGLQAAAVAVAVAVVERVSLYAPVPVVM